MAKNVTATEIREGVRATFTRVAETPTQAFRFPVGAALARQVGYPEDVLSSLPPPASEAFTGLAYLHPHLNLRPGERVLDLGSGGGLDAVLAARAVFPGGGVTGLDLAEAMIARARALAASFGVKDVEFVSGDAEAMPFAAGTFDSALVNGFFNLCPEKAKVARELHRVLRPGRPRRRGRDHLHRPPAARRGADDRRLVPVNCRGAARSGASGAVPRRRLRRGDRPRTRPQRAHQDSRHLHRGARAPQASVDGPAAGA